MFATKTKSFICLLTTILSFTVLQAQSIEGTPYCLPKNGTRFTRPFLSVFHAVYEAECKSATVNNLQNYWY